VKRPVWLAAGVALGVGGTLWAEQRVRRRMRRLADRLSPDSMAAEARDRARDAGERVRAAVESGRREQRRTEEALWQDLGRRDDGLGRPHDVGPGRPGHRSTHR
jgi:hypothetical protein